MSNYRKKKSFLVLTSGKFLEALGCGIGTGSIFCLSFSLLNIVFHLVEGNMESVQYTIILKKHFKSSARKLRLRRGRYKFQQKNDSKVGYPVSFLCCAKVGAAS